MKTLISKYLTPILLILVFVAPGLLAYFYYHHPHELGLSQINKGTLLSPPRLLTLNKSDSKWRLIVWRPFTCETGCIEQLEQLARMRLALGRRLYNLDLYLLLGGQEHALTEKLIERMRQEDIHVLKSTANTVTDGFKLPPKPQVYLEDPHGYLVLSYPQNVNPSDIFHDIKRLLNAKN